MNEQPANEIRLSVVVPTYNKAMRIAATLGSIASYLSKKPFASEIVVVDDGSSDGTADAARTALAAFAGRIGSKVIRREENLGKGAAVKEGVLASAGAIVLFTDDDLSTPIEEFDKLQAALEAGADAAIGSRALAASEIRVRQPRPREGMGKMFNRLVRLLVLEGYPDTQCGFKAFRREAARIRLLPPPDRRLRLRRRGPGPLPRAGLPRRPDPGRLERREAQPREDLQGLPGDAAGSSGASAASTGPGGNGISASSAWPSRCSRSCWRPSKTILSAATAIAPLP